MDNQIRVVHISVGDLYITDRPVNIITVVGSCLAVIMRVPRLSLAGMTHPIYPKLTSPDLDGLQCVDSAMERMLAKFISLGAALREIDVKIFGGSSTIVDARRSSIDVGALNTAAAREFIRTNGLCLSAHDTGGRTGRKVMLDVASGTVSVKMLAHAVVTPRETAARAAG
ncbi:MAG: chemotaxis protein CheD [Spirochaetes bacterium]|nr:chemotaxis protein CheD [Spirochaetota bacterium]